MLALWSILDGAERDPVEPAGVPERSSGGREYEAMVVAMNQLLERLSRDIASAIQRLASRVVARE